MSASVRIERVVLHDLALSPRQARAFHAALERQLALLLAQAPARTDAAPAARAFAQARDVAANTGTPGARPPAHGPDPIELARAVAASLAQCIGP